MPAIHVGMDGFAGAQKVYESEASLSLELSLILDRRVRINAAVSHYFEDQMDGGRVTMDTSSATVGLRLGNLRATRLWADVGYAHVATHDPAGSSSVHGPTVDLRLERDLTSLVLVTGSAGVMLFDAFEAYTGRIGVRVNHIEAGFRVLDFTVGPALFGPEIGVAF